ncbi:SpaA isopeptide-forming pilin-related protein [Holdemanella biformis]
MKLIKKIAAIMFAFIMVFSLSTNVKADDNSGDSTTTGTITIENSNARQTYNLYRILDLESYNNTDKAYSYKLSTKWTGFLEYPGVNVYLKKNTDNDYVTWVNAKKDPETMRVFVKLALKYAEEKSIAVDESIKNDSTTVKNITTNPLKLGYYLVSSSAGSLISIDTNNPNKNIQEKNGVPTITKNVSTDHGTTYSAKKNSVNAGDTVGYQTTITFKPGAKNYKLHDTMDSKLEFQVIHDAHTNLSNSFNINKYIELNKTPTDGCTFEVTFKDVFYTDFRDKIDNNELKSLTISYHSIFKEENGSYIDQPMKNTTHLTYGDNDTESNTDETETYTFGVPVLKYTEENGVRKTLANAQFNLYKESVDNEENKLKFTYDPANEYYRLTKSESGDSTMISNGTKAFTITGLEAGTYYLKETKAPNGYNTLTSPIKIEIKQKDDGTQQILMDTKEVKTVKVLNNKGSLLPSTGGMGTTLIYLIGGALVLGSGFVLMNKKRAKAK